MLVYKVVGDEKNWSYQSRDNSYSYIRFFVKESEFSHNYFKKLAIAVLNKNFEDGIDYVFEDIQNIL